MTSATEGLRRMLDEYGVEWWEDAFSGEHRTVFDGKDGVRYCVYQLGSSLFISSILPVTPEQAIAATLGSSNCTNGERTETCHDEGDPSDFCCSECGVRMFTNTSDTYTMIASDGRTIIKHPNYCPNCGRRIVDEKEDA